jgi:hypothetical protein
VGLQAGVPAQGRSRMTPYERMMSEKIYYPGDMIPWAYYWVVQIKPRIRVKMGRA